MAGNEYAESFRIARLFKRTSKNGSTYFSGRLGFAKVALVKSKEVGDDGAEIWSLMVSEAQQAREERSIAAATGGGSPAPTTQSRGSREPYAERNRLDDEIPF